MAGKLKDIFQRIAAFIKNHSLTFSAGLLFAVLCFIALNYAMDEFSRSEYCGTACHEMKDAYQSWKNSKHYANTMGIRTECVDCHVPSKDHYFANVSEKIRAGTDHLIKHYRGIEYNEERSRAKVIATLPDEWCTSCHNDLLSKPASVASKIAHDAWADPNAAVKTRCMDCHYKLHGDAEE